MASPGRVQAPELNLRPSLNPAPMVNVAMVSPVNRSGAGSNLLKIADSLSGLSGAVGNYGITMAKAGKMRAAEAEAARKQADADFKSQHGWKSPEGIASSPGYIGSPEQQVLVGNAYGTEVGDKLWAMAQKEYDPETDGDFNTWLDSKIAELQSQLPEPAQLGFGESIKATANSVRQKYFEYLNGEEVAAMKADTFRHFIQQGEVFKDLPAGERAQKMKESGLDQYRAFNLTSGKESSDLLLNAIKYYADSGDVEMAEALANLQRGSNGEVPSLLDTPDYREEVDAALINANKNWVIRNNGKKIEFSDGLDKVLEEGSSVKLQEYFDPTKNKNEYLKRIPDAVRMEEYNKAREKLSANIVTNTSKAQVETEEATVKGAAVQLFESAASGQVFEDRKIITKDGKEVTIKGADVAEAGVNEHIAKRYEAAAAGDDPDIIAFVDKDVARKAAFSPIPIKAWEDTNDTALTQMNALALEQGKMTPQTARAYELWKNTRDNREVYLAKGGRNAEKLDSLFSMAQVLIDGGQPPEAALAAVTRTDVDTKFVNDRMADAVRINDDLEKELNSLPVKLAKDVDTETRVLIANNVDPTTALKKAVTRQKERVIEIDTGAASGPSKITYPRGMTDPKTKERFVKGVENIVELNKRLAPKQDRPVNPDDIMVVDHGDGTYSLTEDGFTLPAFMSHRGEGDAGEGVLRFTAQDLDAEMRFIEDQEKAKTFSKDVEGKNVRNPGGKSVMEIVTDKFTGGGDDKPEVKEREKPEPILGGFNTTVEDYFGARSFKDISKLDDFRLRQLRDAAKNNKLEDIGFASPEVVEKVWKDRASTARRKSGFSKDQVDAAMSRWNVDELEAIERLKKNKAEPSDGYNIDTSGYSEKQINDVRIRFRLKRQEAVKYLKDQGIKPDNQ